MANDDIVVDRDGYLWRRNWLGDLEPVRDDWGNHLREGGGDSGCFITSACIRYRGLSDDCEELAALRRFRDGYVATLPEGSGVIEEYYRNAPRVVAAIENSLDRDYVYRDLYAAEVATVLRLLEEGRDREAFERCMTAYGKLKDRYLLD